MSGTKFRGFSKPTYTAVPDQVFDEMLPTLSGSELKVLMYICRRTFGYKKSADSISLSQLANGITRRDGEILDRGTGLALSAVRKALASLIERGVITKRAVVTDEHGNQANVYALHFADESDTPLCSPGGKGGSQNRHPLCSPGGIAFAFTEAPPLPPGGHSLCLYRGNTTNNGQDTSDKKQKTTGSSPQDLVVPSDLSPRSTNRKTITTPGGSSVDLSSFSEPESRKPEIRSDSVKASEPVAHAAQAPACGVQGELFEQCRREEGTGARPGEHVVYSVPGSPEAWRVRASDGWWVATAAWLREIESLYPNVNVLAEVRRMAVYYRDRHSSRNGRQYKATEMNEAAHMWVRRESKEKGPALKDTPGVRDVTVRPVRSWDETLGLDDPNIPDWRRVLKRHKGAGSEQG